MRGPLNTLRPLLRPQIETVRLAGIPRRLFLFSTSNRQRIAYQPTVDSTGIMAGRVARPRGHLELVRRAVGVGRRMNGSLSMALAASPSILALSTAAFTAA